MYPSLPEIMLILLGFLLHPPWKKVISGNGIDGSFTEVNEQDELRSVWDFMVIDEVETKRGGCETGKFTDSKL